MSPVRPAARLRRLRSHCRARRRCRSSWNRSWSLGPRLRMTKGRSSLSAGARWWSSLSGRCTAPPSAGIGCRSRRRSSRGSSGRPSAGPNRSEFPRPSRGSLRARRTGRRSARRLRSRSREASGACAGFLVVAPPQPSQTPGTPFPVLENSARAGNLSGKIEIGPADGLELPPETGSNASRPGHSGVRSTGLEEPPSGTSKGSPRSGWRPAPSARR
jgi:hypothetical protein